MSVFDTGSAFEDEVRRIARLLWPSAAFDGASIEDGRERDGIFETDDFVHVVECTTMRTRAKAGEDASKIAKLMRRLVTRHPTKFIKGWFVTLDEPTADQRMAVKEVVQKEKTATQIVAMSFDQFRSRLIDARSYLSQRQRYAFGSVRHPESGTHDFELQYVPLELLDEEGSPRDVVSVAASLLGGSSVVLLGDYGAGKSSTMRELFLRLLERFWANDSLSFPILLNLRDHHGQTDPVEALERHARNVGFTSPDALVRAWRAGYGIILLDGFDEIAAAGWAGRTRTLKELRHRSMELIRGFVRQTPVTTGIGLAGRAHFFDNDREMDIALALRPRTTKLNLSEFSADQVNQFLGRLGWTDPIPDWLPSRPLLLAYLAAAGLLRTTLNLDGAADPASGWDSLLARIAARESELEAGIDPETVRRLIEHLAMQARSSADGLGPLAPDTILEAFKSVCGYAPDDRGAVLLQRLPGLGGHHREDGARVFIDKDFAEAARGTAIFRIIENPYVIPYSDESWQNTILPLAAQVGAYRCVGANHTTGKVGAAVRHLIDGVGARTIAADVVLVLIEMGGSIDTPTFIREVVIPELVIEDAACDSRCIEFQDCIIGELRLASDFPDRLAPRFVRCHFGRIEGRTGERDLPVDRFHECDFEAFDQPATTTSAIMGLTLPLGTKVMLTILKKMYAQSGSGRKEAALYRGLDPRARELVPGVLNVLRKAGFVSRSTRGTEHIWMPTRTADSRRRALSMLASPSSSTDPIIHESRQVG